MLARFRRSWFVLLLVAPLLGARPAAAGAQPDASGFIRGLADQAIPILTRSDLPEAQREAHFRHMLHEGFDMNRIARLVLGRYWNQATPEEQAEFVGLLESYLVRLYAARFADYQGVRLQVEGSRSDQGQTIVRSTLLRPGDPPVALDWRVETASDRYVITDLIVEGVSMIITQRSEFASVIRQKGGRVEGLLQLLRQRAARS